MAKRYTPPPECVHRTVNLEPSAYDPDRQDAWRRDLMQGRFGAALRTMIRQWYQLHPPTDPHTKYPPALQPPAVRKTER